MRTGTTIALGVLLLAIFTAGVVQFLLMGR